MKAAVVDAVGAGFKIAEVELLSLWGEKYSLTSGPPASATPI
jgi:hypothetical protein